MNSPYNFGRTGTISTVETRNRVLRNTYWLLALSMIPTVLGAWVGVATGFSLFAATSPAMSLLAFQKLRDVESFSSMFLNYDLLARRWVPYAYIYPIAEGLAGVLMAAGVATMLAAPLALFIGGVGAISVFKAVYIDKRELKCACVGGDTNVPLGFVSLTENVMMVAMALWMLTA